MKALAPLALLLGTSAYGLAQELPPNVAARLKELQPLLGIPLSAGKFQTSSDPPRRLRGRTLPASTSVYGFSPEGDFFLVFHGNELELRMFYDHRALLRKDIPGKLSDQEAIERAKALAVRFGLPGLSVRFIRRDIWNDGSPSRGPVVRVALHETRDGLMTALGKAVNAAFDARDGRLMSAGFGYRSAFDDRPVAISEADAMSIARRLAQADGYTGAFKSRGTLWWPVQRWDERGVPFQVRAYEMSAMSPDGTGNRRYWIDANTAEVFDIATSKSARKSSRKRRDPVPAVAKPTTARSAVAKPTTARSTVARRKPDIYSGPGTVERPAVKPSDHSSDDERPVWPWAAAGLALAGFAGGLVAMRRLSVRSPGLGDE
jgi:hypothetical protein